VGFQEWRGKAASSRGKLDEAKANQSDNRTKNNVLDSLTRLKDSGNVDGFHVSFCDHDVPHFTDLFLGSSGWPRHHT